MSALQYHSLWLAIALAAVAVASALIARRLAWREWRRAQAEAALDALARYSEWLGAQRRTAAFAGDVPAERSALAELRAIQQLAFPELSGGLMALLQVHARALDFLWRQQVLRLRDAEAWLESDHDARFMALWEEHGTVVHALADRLRESAGGPLVDAEPESVYPV